MADQEQQYLWVNSGGFNVHMIPATLIGLLLGPFIVLLIRLSIEGEFEKAFMGGDKTTLQWPSIAEWIIGIPLGAFFGARVAKGINRNRLRWCQWAEKHGWKYEAKPGNHLGKNLQHAQQLKNANLLWKHATNSNLISRQLEDRVISIHTAIGYTHIDFLHGDDSKKKKSIISIFLLMDTKTDCPDMIIHSHKMTDHLKLPSHFQTVTFESNEFNRQWTVKAQDPKAAYDRLNQKTLEFLIGKNPQLLIEFIDGLLVIQHRLLDFNGSATGRPKVAAYEQLLEFTQTFTEAVPDDLLEPINFNENGLADSHK